MGTLAGIGFGFIAIVFYLAFLALGIYITVLLIMFLRRGIKALDMYLSKNSSISNDLKID